MERIKKRSLSDDMQSHEDMRRTRSKSEPLSNDHEEERELQFDLCLDDLGPVLGEGISGHVLELNATPEGLVLKVVRLPKSNVDIC